MENEQPMFTAGVRITPGSVDVAVEVAGQPIAIERPLFQMKRLLLDATPPGSEVRQRQAGPLRFLLVLPEVGYMDALKQPNLEEDGLDYHDAAHLLAEPDPMRRAFHSLVQSFVPGSDTRRRELLALVEYEIQRRVLESIRDEVLC